MNLTELILIIITILISLGTFGWSSYQYFNVRKREQDLKEFENYHKLIKELVEPDEQTGVLWIDRQAAIVYELRYFRRYYEFSYRTLKQLKGKWDHKDQYPRIIEEINLTLEFIDKNLKK